MATATGTARKAQGQARRAQRQARRAKSNPVVDRLARAGLGARAVVYLVLAFLAADIALTGGAGKQASSKGALEELAHQPAGPVLLVLLAAGFACYAGWRFLQAAAGDPTRGDEIDAAKRVVWAGIGVTYAVLGVRAVLVLADGGSKGGNPAFSLSREMLGVTGGRQLLALVGLGVAGAGIGLAVWGATQGFERYLESTRIPPGMEPATRVFETFGQVTRGLVFAAIGASLVAAAVAGDSRQAKGMDQALRGLVHHPYGPAALGVVAAGLASFGVASVLEAVYRRT